MEIDYEKLEKLGIKIAERNYSKSNPQKMLCPKCKDDRKKHKKNKTLAVYWKDCYAKCFNCGESFFFGKTEKLNDGQKPKTQVMEQKSKEYKKPGRLAPQAGGLGQQQLVGKVADEARGVGVMSYKL